MSSVSFEFANPFTRDGVWLKGNTHTHTTESDGQFPPDVTGREYGKLGFDFVFLTDHRKRTVAPAKAEGGPLLISGEEVDFSVNGSFYHVVVLGAPEGLYRPSYESLDQLIEMAEEADASLIMAHPYWLGARSEEFIRLKPFLGVEVYNTVCDGIGKAYSSIHWDDMLEAGRRVFGFAADDFHFLTKGIAGGWIMAKARDLSEEAVLESIRAGHFYSTQGPEIRNVEIQGEEIRVECSPVQRINFISNRFNGGVFRAGDGESLTEATWAARGWLIPTTYVRIECIDAARHTAWSNPIYIHRTP